MRLMERVRGFGRRSSSRSRSGVAPAATNGALEQSVLLGDALWSAEDYLGMTDPTDDLEDHWAEVPPQGRLHGTDTVLVSVASSDGGIPEHSRDHVVNIPPASEMQGSPVGDDLAFEDFNDLYDVSNATAGWNEHGEPDLPFFDPAATAAPVLSDVFSGRHVWRVGTRAGILALATAIPHRHGREAAASLFEEALSEGRWPGFFRSWLRLAPSLECPRVIALAIELKQHWDDSPHLWRFRDAPGRPTRQHESARGQMGWRRALAMAEARTHEPAWRILDDDLIADWEDLGEPCHGFWSLAEWMEIMCCGEESEVHSLGMIAARGRDHRVLHLQDMCERLGLGRVDAAGGLGRMPMVDQDVATFPFRDGHFRPGAGATLIERRAPTDEEMQVREVE